MTWAIEEKNYSQAGACALIGLAPKTYRYQAKREGDEAIRKRLRELASERRRFGYRRLHLLLRREGMTLNRKKLYRKGGFAGLASLVGDPCPPCRRDATASVTPRNGLVSRTSLIFAL